MENKKFIRMQKDMAIYNLSHLPQVIFEVTDACNLKCKYCAFSDLYTGYDPRGNNYLSFNYAKNTIDYLVDFWKTHSSTVFPTRLNIGFYGGEPLLNFTLIKEAISYIESLGNIGRTLSYSMTTNATLLDKYIDYLVEKDFSLLISFDGDESAQGFRLYKNGKNSFTDVYSNVKFVQEKYPNFFEKNISFNAVLHSRNDIESIYDFFKTNFSKTPKISALSDSGINKETWSDYKTICNDYAGSFCRISDSKIREIEEASLLSSPVLSRFYKTFESESGNVFYNFHELLFNKKDLGVFPTGSCLPFSKRMFVTVHGKLLQCERIDHEYFLGQVTNHGVELDLDQLTNNYNKDIFKYMHQCVDCIAKERCPVCIYRVDDFHKTVNCPSYKKGEKIKLNLTLLRKNPQLLDKVYQIKTIK